MYSVSFLLDEKIDSIQMRSFLCVCVLIINCHESGKSNQSLGCSFNNSFIFFHNSQQTKAFPTEIIYLTVNISEEKYHWYALSRLHL